MNKQSFALALAAMAVAPTLWSTQSMAASGPTQACQSVLIEAPTSFPDRYPRARRGGTVRLELSVAPDGSVLSSAIRGSSGSLALDLAALQSSQQEWKFAPSSCDKPVRKEVTVQFEPLPPFVFSATRTPGYRKQLMDAAARGCAIDAADPMKAVISCISGKDESRTRLAVR